MTSTAASASASPSQFQEGTDTGTSAGLAIGGVVVFAVLLTLVIAWAAKYRGPRRRAPRDPEKPFAPS